LSEKTLQFYPIFVSSHCFMKLNNSNKMIRERFNILDEESYLEFNYPSVLYRLKAALIDTSIIIAFMFIVISIFSFFENVPDSFRIGAFMFIFIFYDPLFTSIFGGTVGHMIMKIQVKRINNLNKNIPFILALIRYIVKVSLGWISLLTVTNNKKKLAIHDMVVRSIVLYK
jgi:uncharacterized RDD family membrane protein YckC